MEGKTTNQSEPAKSGSVVKPVPLYYYVDQFERLYQQSPMAKMFRQGIIKSPAPKGLIPQNGQSRNSTTAKTFKLPLVSKSTPSDRDPSSSKPEAGVELNVQEGRGNKPDGEQCFLLMADASESDSTVAESLSSGTSQDQIGIADSKRSFVSPSPRLQGQAEVGRRGKTPNLHNLIQRLATPVKDEGEPTSEKPKRSKQSEDEEAGHETPDQEGGTNMHLRRRNTRNQGGRTSSGNPPVAANSARACEDRDHHEVAAFQMSSESGASKRSNQVKSGLHLDPDPAADAEPDAPVLLSSSKRRKGVPQQRLPLNPQPASNPSRNNPVSRPKRKSATNTSTEAQNEVTPKFSLAAVLTRSGPTESQDETNLSDETPVSRRSGGRKTRSQGSKLNVGGLIRSLQAEEEIPRSEVPYTSTTDDNAQEEYMQGHMSDLSMIDVGQDTAEENEDNAEEEEVFQNDIETATAHTASDRDLNDAEQAGSSSTDEQTERNTRNKHSREDSSDETPKIPKKSETIINHWIIKPVPSCKGVCVEGHRVGDKGDQFWHSTAIMVRTGPRLLATKSGSLYRLAGKMDVTMSMEQGFSESLVRSFQRGFPPNWRELIYDHYMMEEERKTKEKASKSASKSVSKKQHFVSPAPSHVSQASTTDTARKVKKKASATAIVTPQNLRVKDLQRSSSGRLIKPPLAYWTGQRVRHNTSLDFVEILQGTEDCTSSSAYQISLQDSLELGPRDKRAIRRIAQTKELPEPCAEKKRRPHQRRDDSDGDDDSSSCREPCTELDNVDHKDITQIRRLRKRLQETVVKRGTSEKATRKKSTIRESSSKADVIESTVQGSNGHIDIEFGVSNKKGRTRKWQRNEKVEEERTMNGAAGSSSSDHHAVISVDGVTDDTISTSSSVDSLKNDRHQKVSVMIHVSSKGSRSKQPPAPQKGRARKEVARVSKEHQGRAPVSPLYYQFSPVSDGAGSQSQTEHLPNVGKTPPSAQRKHNDASGNTISPSSSDPGQTSTSSLTEMTTSELERKSSSSKGSSKGSVGTLNLQEEILAVVEKHKQGRIARMRERSLKFTASSKYKSQVRNTSSTSDVYDLSDDEAQPSPMRIPYLPPTASLSTGESISNWSEEGDKSINETWVTRNNPYKRVYGTLEDTRYKSEENSTDPTMSSSTGTEATLVNNVSSDKDSNPAESSDEAAFKLHKVNHSKYLGTSLKDSRKRRNREPDQTEDEQPQPKPKPVTARARQRTSLREESSVTSSEEADDTSWLRDHRGRKKKTIIVPRHQPMRHCKKSGSDSEMQTSTPGTGLNGLSNTGHSTAVHPDEDSMEELQPATDIRKEKSTSNRKQHISSTPNIVQRETRQRKTPVSEVSIGRQKLEASRKMVAGAADFRNPKESIQFKEKEHRPESATKPTKQQVKHQENHDQIPLTAKVGTMKRKRQLRELVEQHNRGYEDDIFDSTPFKKQKKLKIPLGEWDTEEDSQDSQAGKTPGSARFKTPSVRYQGVRPLSDKKTPYSNIISPGLLPSVDRRHIDQYIHGLQKKKKGFGVTQRQNAAKKVTPSSRNTVRSSGAALTNAMRGKVTDMFDVTPVSDSDPDEDHDYYWSDEES